MGHIFLAPFSEDERCWQVLAEPKRPQVTERLLRLILGVQETDHEVIGSGGPKNHAVEKWRDMEPLTRGVKISPPFTLPETNKHSP